MYYSDTGEIFANQANTNLFILDWTIMFKRWKQPPKGNMPRP